MRMESQQLPVRGLWPYCYCCSIQNVSVLIASVLEASSRSCLNHAPYKDVVSQLLLVQLR